MRLGMRLGRRAAIALVPVGLAAVALLGGEGVGLREGLSSAGSAVAGVAMGAGLGDVVADRVLGQINFTNIAPNFVDAIGFNAPDSVTIDKGAGHAIVADTANSRVLGWKSLAAFASGGPADLVIGQADFNASRCNRGAASADATTLCGPAGVAVDGAHRVYIGDTQNNRILVFDDPFAALVSNGQSSNFEAVLVFGQGGDFTVQTANAGGRSADSLNGPEGVAVDADGNLFAADVENNRALVYFAPLPASAPGGGPGFAGDTTADLVLGQADFIGGACNQGGAMSDATLCMSPFVGVGIALDGDDNLYVADTRNSRAIEFNGTFGLGKTNDPTADLIFVGNNLEFASGVAADSSGNFYVSSESHSQVYEYTQPVALMTATLLNLKIGPGAGNPSSSSLQFPMGLALDALDNLCVADQANNRVLRYAEGASPSTKIANGAAGQRDTLHNRVNFVDAVGTAAPGGVAIDTVSTGPNLHFYAADSANNRVLGWNDVTAFANGKPADIAFGQMDLFSYKCNDGRAGGDVAGVGADSLCGPKQIAVDGGGNLLVADAGNNRVLRYNTPFDAGSGEAGAGDAIADFVYGQAGSMTARSCNASAATLCNPSSVAVGATGDIYIADAGNNRVLEFPAPMNPPVAGDAVADAVLGQSDFAGASCNRGGIPSAATLCNPAGAVEEGAGKIFVADSNNNRVLEFAVPAATGAAAERVFGQAGDFTLSACNRGGTVDGAGLCGPSSASVDAAGNLYVADSGNDRVVEYAAPFVADTTAMRAFGQGDAGSFGTSGCNRGIAPADVGGVGADSLCAPGAVVLDGQNNMYVADSGNNRVLFYDSVTLFATPTPSPTASATVSVTPTATASETATATASATASASPTPTSTPTPTATPTSTPAMGGKLSYKPKSIKFGKVAVGSQSKPRTLNIRNAGTLTLSAEVQAQAGQFAVASGGGGFKVSPKGSHTVTIQFMPTAVGPASSSVEIMSSDPKHRQESVRLSGRGK